MDIQTFCNKKREGGFCVILIILAMLIFYFIFFTMQHGSHFEKTHNLRNVCSNVKLNNQNFLLCSVPHFYINKTLGIRMTKELQNFAKHCFLDEEQCPSFYLTKNNLRFPYCEKIAPFQALFLMCYQKGNSKYITVLQNINITNQVDIQKLWEFFLKDVN